MNKFLSNKKISLKAKGLFFILKHLSDKKNTNILESSFIKECTSNSNRVIKLILLELQQNNIIEIIYFKSGTDGIQNYFLFKFNILIK